MDRSFALVAPHSLLSHPEAMAPDPRSPDTGSLLVAAHGPDLSTSSRLNFIEPEKHKPNHKLRYDNHNHLGMVMWKQHTLAYASKNGYFDAIVGDPLAPEAWAVHNFHEPKLMTMDSAEAGAVKIKYAEYLTSFAEKRRQGYDELLLSPGVFGQRVLDWQVAHPDLDKQRDGKALFEFLLEPIAANNRAMQLELKRQWAKMEHAAYDINASSPFNGDSFDDVRDLLESAWSAWLNISSNSTLDASAFVRTMLEVMSKHCSSLAARTALAD